MLHPSRRHLEAVVRNTEGHQVARCLLRRARYIIGQDRKNEIVVDEPSVSGRHARLTVVSDNEMYIEDTESANGTLVDGNPAAGLNPVSVDSHIQIGSCTLEFQRGSLPASIFQYLPDGFLREHRYNFGEIVVEGNTSTIYEAYDTSLGRDVAIRIMHPEMQANATQVLRFIREAQITSQLAHPNILPIYELGLDEQSQLFFTTHFVEGHSLMVPLSKLGIGESRMVEQYPLTQLLAIFQKVCDAVAFAHNRGVVHCGLRPEAITLGGYGEVFVINWGLSKIMDLDAEGAPFGRPVHSAPPTASPMTTPYTPPELIDGSFDEVTPVTDVYSLGALLYHCLTLRPPIAAENDRQLMEKIAAGVIESPVAPGRHVPHCPSGKVPEMLAAIAMRAMSIRPEERPASVMHLQAEVSAWQAGLASGEGKIWKQFTGLLGKKG